MPRNRGLLSAAGFCLLLGATAALLVPGGASSGGPGTTGHLGLGGSIATSIAFDFGPAAQLSIAQPTAAPATLDVGQNTTFSVQADGGTGPYTYAWSGLPIGCATGNASTLVCFPTRAGISDVSVELTDATGAHSQSSSITVTVNPRVTVSQFSMSSYSVSTGEDLKISVVASGGTGNLSYAYAGLPQGCQIFDSPILDCHPVLAGAYFVLVIVLDRLGERANGSGNLQVTGLPSVGPVNPPSPLIDLESYAPAIIVVSAVATAIAVVVVLGRKRAPPTPP
jgi:hypothetical protein